MSRPLLPVNGFSSFFSDVGEGVEEEEEEELMDVMARPLTLDRQGEEREDQDPVREVVRPVEEGMNFSSWAGRKKVKVFVVPKIHSRVRLRLALT